jgi:hypothetical protein
MSVFYQDGAPAHRRFSTPGKGAWVLFIAALVLFGGPAISPAVVQAASGYVTGTVDQRTQQAHEASQALAETGDERGTEAGERFVSNSSAVLTEVSNFIEDVKASLAGEVR